MYAPRQYGRFTRGDELSGEDARAVERLARIVTNAKLVSGLDSVKRVMTLPSGREAVAVDMGGTFRIYINDRDVFEQQIEGIAQDTVPMLYSGNIEAAVVPVGEGVPLRPTDTTRLRLAGYPEDGAGAGGPLLYLQRFAVEYAPEVDELRPKVPDLQNIYTQFGHLHSTWYTGAMAEVVQIAKGFGIQDDDQLPEHERGAKLRIPEAVRKKILAEMGGNTRLPGYSGMPSPDGQIHYDYKWPSTDAVAFDGTGQPWLVKVSSGAAAPPGVWAMPLPTIPATATQAFRDWMEEVNDREILAILNRFGAIPSGEGWPRDFYGWVRAGVIIKVCDTSDYFEHTPYSTACGFAFNSRGTEAFATCWKFNEGDDAINEGLAYKLRLALGPATEQGKLPLGLEYESDATRDRVTAYLSELYRRLKAEYEDPEDGTKTLTPIYYKIRRHTAEQIADMSNGGVDLDYWINVEMQPIADHEGMCAQVGQGYLVGVLPGIKYPEPFYTEPACLTPDGYTRYKSDDQGNLRKYPRCDTIVYGFYDTEDSLKVIKYFREDPKEGRPAEEEPECPYSGTNQWRGASAGTSIMGEFYTTDFDDRALLDRGYTTYTTKGSYIGPTRWYGWQTAFFWTTFRAGRSEYYDRERWETQIDYHTLDVATLIPWGFRSGYVYAKSAADRIAGSMYRHWWERVLNRTTVEFWSFNSGSAWVGSPQTQPYPNPAPVNFSFALEDGRNTQPPQRCTPEADSVGWIPSAGEFAAGLRNGYVYVGQLPKHDPFGDGPKWNPVEVEDPPRTENEKHQIQFSYAAKPIKLSDLYVPNYFRPSPELQSPQVFWIYGAANCFGDAKYVFISEGSKHIGDSKYITSIGSQKRVPRFIGVINE
ncbi:MAG: hypothetical protein RBS10_01495 [Thauera propionica]|jgi:hypothetical protein|nr:hypothetical protein [Thauera propionica]